MQYYKELTWVERDKLGNARNRYYKHRHKEPVLVSSKTQESIPSRANLSLDTHGPGPAAYKPSTSYVKGNPNIGGSDFSRSKSERNVFTGKKGKAAPGSYETNVAIRGTANFHGKL